MRAALALAGALAVAAPLSGCIRGGGVERVYDGDVIEGRFVGAEAYAAFLRGALADADGHAEEAATAYEEAAARQPASAEAWTRLGDVRCRHDPNDPRAQAALSHALSIDGEYAPAWAARASCALSRGDEGTARTAALRAAELDPAADASNALLARLAHGGLEPGMRARLLALTATARNAVVAWDALASWARAAGDVSLWAQALHELVGRAPARRAEIVQAAESLAGLGQPGAARSVAAAAVDASGEPLPAGHPLAARLAVDEAIGRHDGGAVRARATRVRMSLEEAAGRALLAGDRALARELALEVMRADPASRGARLALVACGGVGIHVSAQSGDVSPGGAPVAASVLIALGVSLASRGAPGPAREALQSAMSGPVEALVNGDDAVERPAVEIVSRGVLDRGILPADALVELAAIQSDAAALAASPAPAPLDLRHEYLALAMRAPTELRTSELKARLGSSGGDPIVAAAAALVGLATGAPIAAEAPAALLARNPADPLLASIALRMAERVGDRDVAGRAQRTLTALGGSVPAKE